MTGITQDIYTYFAPRVGRDAADQIAALLAASAQPPSDMSDATGYATG